MCVWLASLPYLASTRQVRLFSKASKVCALRSISVPHILYMNTHISTCTSAHVKTQKFTHIHGHTFTCTCTCLLTHTDAHAHAHTHMHTHTHLKSYSATHIPLKYIPFLSVLKSSTFFHFFFISPNFQWPCLQNVNSICLVLMLFFW